MIKVKGKRQKVKVQGKKQKYIDYIFWVRIFTFTFLLFTLFGCDAFVRKFTRKKKQPDQPVEMVLAPEEYKPPQMTIEQRYYQYFNFWESWHDELITSLNYKMGVKRHLDCLNEAVKNLEMIRSMVAVNKQAGLDKALGRMKELADAINQDPYNLQSANNAQTAERIKGLVIRDYRYNRIKDYLL